MTFPRYRTGIWASAADRPEMWSDAVFDLALPGLPYPDVSELPRHISYEYGWLCGRPCSVTFVVRDSGQGTRLR